MKEWELPSGEPATPRYKGPVRRIYPTWGQGYAEMFCPKCGSTDIESLGKYGKKYGCRECGRVFKLELTDAETREYSIYGCGYLYHEGLSAGDIDDCAYDTI